MNRKDDLVLTLRTFGVRYEDLSDAVRVEEERCLERASRIETLILDVFVQVEESLTFEYPRTWWDAVKLRFFPRWWLRRWPAKVEIRRLERLKVYPDPIPRYLNHNRWSYEAEVLPTDQVVVETEA